MHDAALASVRALENDFLNQNVVLTGHEPMRVFDLLEMLAEIMGIQKPVEFEDRSQSGHYVRTPYSSVTDMGRKYTPPLHIDLGQGLINLIEELRSENKG